MTINKKLYGEGLVGALGPAVRSPLRDEFVQPPFSVLNARDGDWQKRKRKWLALGIQSEIGRGGNLVKYGEMMKYNMVSSGVSLDTSIFDPVLAELAYSWFCPPGGIVLDPYAGGSVRGIVASVLGYKYYGIDLRADQVAANKAQLNEHTRGKYKPKWVVGDSYHEVPKAPLCDFIFACPPYGPLEAYGDDERDLSNMSAIRFNQVYSHIIHQCAARLKDNRFACFVVGNYRDETGCYVNLHGITTWAFGSGPKMNLYNDAVLITQVTTLSMRTRKMFATNRKLGKGHQNVLVFCKGDWKLAAKAAKGEEV